MTRGEDCPPDKFWYLRYDCEPSHSGSVQPIGNPINHSRHSGFNFPWRPSAICTATDKEPRELAGPPAEMPLAFRTSYPRIRAFSHASGVRPSSRAFGVGHDPDPIPAVRCANGGRWYAIPVRIEPDLGQVSENAAEPVAREGTNVFHDRVGGSYFANKTRELSPESRPFVCEPLVLACGRYSLTGESSANNVNWAGDVFCMESPHIFKNLNSRPVFPKDRPCKRVTFTERDRLHSRALKT
jgi:hypothetical protein